MKFCPNCGKEVSGNFCTNCGYKNLGNAESKSNDVSKEELLNTYAGKNADKVYNRNWNWSAFIFGPLYYFYRKLWLEGAILLFINIILNSVIYDIFGDIIYFLLFLIIHVVSSVLFSKLYANKANKKIDSILAKNLTKEELMLEVQKKGGTVSCIPIIIVGVLFGIPLIGAIFYAYVWPEIMNDVNTSKNCEVATCNEDKSYCYTVDDNGNIEWEGSCQN